MKKLVYYAGLYTASAGLLKLAGFSLSLWLARTLPVNDFANYGLLFALQTGITTFGLVGILEAIIGLLGGHRTEGGGRKLFSAANSAFFLTLPAAIIFTLVLFAIFGNGANISTLTLSCVVASGALMAFSSLQAHIVRLEEKHISSLCFNFLFPLAGVAGSFVAFYFERTIQSFFLGSVVGLLVSLIGLWIGRVGFYGVAGRMEEIRPILLRVVPFIAVAFMGWLSGYGNNYVVNFLFKPIEVAKFTFALSLSSIMQLIATALNQVWSPRFYKIIHELSFDQAEDKNRRFYQIQSLVLGVFGGLVIALYPLSMSALGGNLATYKSMGFELLCLFSAYVILGPWWHCANYLLVNDKGSSVMRVTVITSVVGIPVWIFLMWSMGSIGIYIGFLTQMLFRSMGIWVVTRKYWPVKVSWGGVVCGVCILSLGYLVSTL